MPKKAVVGRVAFERMLADIMVRCANAEGENVVAEIERALERLVEVLGYNRCTYTEFAADGTLHVVCSAARGVPPLPPGPLNTRLTWLVGELRAGRVVALDHLPDDLPPEATGERVRFAQTGLRSHLSIPLKIDGKVAGALSFASFHRPLAWRKDVITRLSLVGEVFASGTARARSKAEARALRGRLWHADRVARVGALTAAIAHEINQPLAAILSNAQAGLARLAKGDAPAAALREILESVVRDDKRAAETIRAMRALLRREEGRHERVDLAEVLREVLQLLAAELARQGVHAELALEPGCCVVGDKTQIGQVALNLVLNALAAMEQRPRGERSLRLAAARTADGRVAVEVRDAGEGIAADRLERIFEPFQTTRKDGLGLGLAICRSIVEAHGGSIGVEPNSDRGVTFRFELAAAASAPAEQAPPRREIPAVQAAARSGPLICLVDDDAAVRESTARLLAAEGYAVLSYASAEAFLAAAPFGETGCVVLDLQLPGMSGIELQERLAGVPDAPPVVFLAGSGDVDAGVAAMKRGAVDFLAKPADQAPLLAALRAALEQRAGRRTLALQRDVLAERLARLSAREREVMAQVIRGRLNKQIAATLNIALQTVKQHRARVMEKMEAGSVAELMRILGPDQPPRAMIAASSTAPTAASEMPHSQGLPPA